MSTELFSPRSASRVYGSTHSCSSSEASSRLAARLERSEYKRSRAKLRVNNHSRSHSKRKESKSNRKKNSSTKETLTKSEKDGVTSVWEVYRQNPYYYSDKLDEYKTNRDQRNTWYGIPTSTNNEPTERRPRSTHIAPSSDYVNLEYQSKLSRKQTERNLCEQSLNDKEFDVEPDKQAANYNGHYSSPIINRQNSTEIHGAFSLDKKGMYLSRSLSSSFSSYIGSSDEKEDSQGIYSAYDVASRSPYGSMMRRYSQSSLSSSNASWQHQSPSHNYSARDLPPLLDPLSPKPYSTRQNHYYSHDYKGEFQPIKESPPPPLPPKPSKFSSSYTIQLNSVSAKESTIWSQCSDAKGGVETHVTDVSQNKRPKVREIARKFTPASVRHISSVCTSQETEDRSLIKTEQVPSSEKTSNNISSQMEVNTASTKGVVMRQKEPNNKTPEEAASQRLSLQELIQLHEEQIAIQAKSAQTNLSHGYLKKSPDVSPSKFFDSKADMSVKDFSGEKESSVDQEHTDYEVHDVVVSQSSPFKVIELTNKTCAVPKGRSSRLKRHRTIGIVGYRHQIDRTSEENVQTKLKRHTTVGIVHNFTEKADTSHSNDVLKEDHTFLKEPDLKLGSVNVTSKGGNKDKMPFPVKIFDIEANAEQDDMVNSTDASNRFDERTVQAKVSDSWYSDPLKDNSLWENDKQKTPNAQDYMQDKSSGSTSSITLHEQPNKVLEKHTNNENHQSYFTESASRNHSLELKAQKKDDLKLLHQSETSYSTTMHLDLAKNNRHNLNASKSHKVPVAQVSPVGHSFENEEAIGRKRLPLSPPPREPPSAHEMYQTRLALWDLLPDKGKSNSDLSEPHDGPFSLDDHSKQSSQSIERPPLKFKGPKYDENAEQERSRISLNFQRLERTEDYYIGVIETLKAENQRLKEKNEYEKREFKRMYEEQKKVANAYQKLEDRYRRRVHELQDALASCTCNGSVVPKESSAKTSHFSNGNNKDGSNSGKNGMRMFEELEEWLSEQSKNSKKINGTSRDSLISSSSDLTGWDEHCDMLDGDIDEINGTHV